MEIKHLLVNKKSDKDYIFIAGEIKDEKLNGWGLEEIVTPEGSKKTYGRFVDGKLDGIGVIKFINNNGHEILEEYGFYKDGIHISDEEFMASSTETKIMETLNKFNLEFVNASQYSLFSKENKVDGPCLIYSHQTYRYGSTDNDYMNHIFKEYRFVSNGIVKGFSFNIKLHPEYQTRYYFTIFEDNDSFFDMIGGDWGYMSTQNEEIFIEEGKEVIERNTYRGVKNVIIHIPHSVHTIAEQAINPKKTNYVEVYYDGTMKEWDNIHKGYYESWCEEDSYRVGMGVSRSVFVDWAVNNFKITIHCTDGDLTAKDHSHSF